MKTVIVAAIHCSLSAFVLLLSIQTSEAGSATWLASPVNGDWNTAGNWTTGGPPNGSSDTATFAASNQTDVSLSVGTQVNRIRFLSGASAFSITANPTSAPAGSLLISGTGIINSSGISQNFVTAVDPAGNSGSIQFSNSATAGSGTIFTNNASIVCAQGGVTWFNVGSTASHATFINNGAKIYNGCEGVQMGGVTSFVASSSADHATIINEADHTGFVHSGGTFFLNTATAGNASITNRGGDSPGSGGGFTSFNGSGSSAGSANITNEGGTAIGAGGGSTGFTNATADNANITNNGGTVSGAGGGSTGFSEASGNNATITANAGLVSGAGAGSILFGYYGGAGNMTLIAHSGPGSGGTIQFSSANNDGGTSRIEVFGNGNLDISQRPFNAGALTIGSIEGSGLVFLGPLNLTVGSNNLTTAFSGVMKDGGTGGGTGGSLTKIGSGTLTLSGANTYTGGTTIEDGTLLVTSTHGASATGTGPVQVNAGTLAGTSTLSGAITVGNGTGSGAFLAPGVNGPGILTTLNTVSFILGSNASYVCEVKTTTNRSDQIIANGVSINSDALFSFIAIGNGTIRRGTVFVVIKNTSGGAIAGTFANLADGSTFTVGSNTFKANYEGGDGNDLTLTVQ